MNAHHKTLLALETSVLLAIRHGANAHKRIQQAQLQASVIGSQAAIRQLDPHVPQNKMITPGYTTPKPFSLEKAVTIAMIATVTRTVLLGSYRQASIATYAANEADGWQWQTEGPHPCPFCLSMEGTVHPLTEEFESHPNCFCDTIPYFG